ncbi:protein STICHEL-like 4 isoform X1 [Salvia splendens]|uniref:protein STICHEL-like 4 isoform X1 n=1 Tax=Salvia splendens TaxID=180675 RepID=UPI001C2577FA|nr:protein STICHEL-like 4 isoform X1 [Salvia splendens]XP_042038993.1 protein STICHEL-like 4 isoform X1 [Salvia splendens]
MTKAVRDRILKDVNGNVSDHLRNHIHLTNCIHLKNHMHKNSPILADRALMRDLVVLQRSRSLRDPSASPPSWQSSSAFDVLLRRGEGEDVVSGRRSVGIERGRVSESSPAPAAVSSRGGKERRARRGEESERLVGNDECEGEGEGLVGDRVSLGSSQLREKSTEKRGGHRQDKKLMTLSDQLRNVPAVSNDAVSSHNRGDARRVFHSDKYPEEAGVSIRHRSSLNRGKRRRFRGDRRSRPSVAVRDGGGGGGEAQNEMSVASNSFGEGRASQKYHGEEEVQQLYGQNVNGDPRNGCGIPWNWSRIHHRGKSFLDMAGRSLSCGLSESRSKKAGSNSRGMDIPNMHVMSSSSSTRSDAEAFPLLLDPSGSRGSIDRAGFFHDYSGELGIYAGNLLKQETDSDLASEGRSREQHRYRNQNKERHQNLTQKYMPRTFRDLVGQNLVVQALSNAILRRKVGLLYLFYGPHGTGKTSCARIFARALNCQASEHTKPCGFCNPCIAQSSGKSRNVREICPVSNMDLESIIGLLGNVTSSSSQLQSQYRVFIFDECDTVSSECWSTILKVIDRAPRRVVFVLVCSSLDALPHIIISRCQKFFFPKLKDADIIYTLQWIATKEDLDIDKEALKLIATRSDGSLRDAEMTLEQLSLIGKRISVALVQELVGLVSDEKLVDLLDLALSADTVNTVKNLRDIMESGVEPLALMSQLATVITDILAGSYDFTKERPKRRFFRRRELSKEDMEKLRQALKTLSEAEKQLRVSNDRITWLTAALLQLAPDQQYMLPVSSAETSMNHSPLVLNGARKSNAEMPGFQAGSSANVHYNDEVQGSVMVGNKHDKGEMNSQQAQAVYNEKLEAIWLDVLEKIPMNSIREFMYQEGKLVSVSYGAAPTVQLLFNSQMTKSKAEKFRFHVLQAFESVLRCPVTIEIRCESRKSTSWAPILLPAAQNMPRLDVNPTTNTGGWMPTDGMPSSEANRREIVEIEPSPREYRGVRRRDANLESDGRNLENAGATSSQKISTVLGEKNQCLTLVKSKVSLAHVIQHAEGCSQHSGWSKRKAVSIAEKLEQENLRLEARSRRLLCWNAPKMNRQKLSRLRIRARKPQTLLKFISCGRCMSGRSPRPRQR